MYEDEEQRVLAVSNMHQTLTIEPVDSGNSGDEADSADEGQPLSVRFTEITDVKTRLTGAYFSDSCATHCLDPGTQPRENLMCASCARIPYQQDFRERK